MHRRPVLTEKKRYLVALFAACMTGDSGSPVRMLQTILEAACAAGNMYVFDYANNICL